jgi:hypothetical protein
MELKMDPRVVVANSFHVKPLIASIDDPAEALLLSFHKRGCSLYRVTSTDSMLHETYVPAGYDLNDRWLEQLSRLNLRDFLDYMKKEIKANLSRKTRLLVIDGASDPLMKRADYWKETKRTTIILANNQTAHAADRGIIEVQAMLVEESKERIRKSVREVLQETSHADLELGAVGRMILDRKICKLFVSLEDLHFGELDPATGNTIDHKSQKNSTDDDLLDDLAELALKNGIQVRVVPKRFLPHNKTFLVA